MTRRKSSGAVEAPSTASKPPEHFYRFRSIDAVVGKRAELEKHEIYFAPPSELNDPLEGFRNVIWRGDHVVWRNLLRHYVLCLLQSTFFGAVAGEEFTEEQCERLIHSSEGALPDAPIRLIYKEVSEAFLAADVTKLALGSLANPVRAVGRDELRFYLQRIHPTALDTVFQRLSAEGVAQQLDPSLKAIKRKLAKALRTLAELRSAIGDIPSAVFAVGASIETQLSLIHEFNNPVPKDRRTWMLLARDFPALYVRASERLMYPPWHTACFSSAGTNASMWGAYGQGHRGVCLKFKASMDSAGAPGLNLLRPTAWGGGRGEDRTHYDFVAHRFERVEYSADYPEIDFFNSLGTVSVGDLARTWFAGPDGELSDAYRNMTADEEKWRDGHWQRFRSSAITKTAEWAHEQEYRLILFSTLFGFDEPKDRALKYRFRDLEGLIFGMNTSRADMLDVMRVIEQNCIAERLHDFKFYQARYSHTSRSIEIVELGLLKVKLT